MPACCTSGTLYKGLFILVVTIVSIQYLYGPITELRQTQVFNNTRTPQHSPMMNALKVQNKLNEKNNVSKTSSIGLNSTETPQVTTQHSEIINSTVIISSGSEEDMQKILNSSYSTPTTIINSNLTTELPLCPEVSSHLRGRIEVVKSPVPTVQELENRFSWLKPGGHWLPTTCKVLKKVALVIPFRCRGEHLLLFLQHMHPFLRRQQLDYTIFIVEQDGDGPFNRAMLMNIGYTEALKMGNFDCFIFHDIDLLPEDDRNLYTCPHEQPRHMSVAVDIFRYKLPYPAIFGGVSAINRDHFKLLNGFSNSFWGWGGEDDDMSNRIRYHNLYISRYPLTIARYTMLTHKKGKPSPTRYDVLKQGHKRFDKDGLNSLKYTLIQSKQNALYTWILVAVETPS